MDIEERAKEISKMITYCQVWDIKECTGEKDIDKAREKCVVCEYEELAEYINSEIRKARVEVAENISNWLSGWTVCGKIDHRLVIDYCEDIISETNRAKPVHDNEQTESEG